MESMKRRALLEAMLTELEEKGYREASVAAASRAAGVAVTEVEAEFGDKDACLFAAYDLLSDEIVARAMNGHCGEGAAWPERVRAGLEIMLREIAANPGMAQVATRSFPGIRPAAYARYVELVGRFVCFMEEGRSYCGLEEELPGDVELLAVGAAEAIIFSELDAGRAERLPQMLPEILFSVLVPFLGPDRAAEEMRSAAGAF